MASAKIGASIKAHAKKRRPRRSQSPAPAAHRGNLSSAEAERMALNLSRPIRAYVQMVGQRYQAYHLVGTKREPVGPTFDGFRQAVKFVRALNAAGVESVLSADGVPFGDWRTEFKRWRPTAKERRQARAKAIEEGRDPDLAVWQLSAA